MRLARPRLLPATIAAMSALFAVKSAILMQAAAGEPPAAPKTNDAPGAQQTGALPADPMVKTAPTTPVTRAAGPAPIATPSAPPTELQISDTERAVLLALRQRRAGLDARARALDQREAELAAADRRLAERVAELQALQTRLEGLEAGREQHKSENWAGLVKTYEAMKPRDAAAIFDALDMQVLLQVLDRMAERRAAPVLAAMQPDRARLATQLLAEMRTRAITPPDTPITSTTTPTTPQPPKG